MKYPKILILSGIYDFSTDDICVELEKRKTEYLRLNLENISQFSIQMFPQKAFIRVSYKNSVWLLTKQTLHSIFFRQPVFLRNTPSKPLTKEEQLYKSQWMAFTRGLMIFNQAKWVNFPQSVYLAESKPYQLYIANQIGFSTPKTIIANCSIPQNFENEIIIKSIDTVYLKNGKYNYFAYSNILKVSQLNDYELQFAPFMMQKLLTNKTDIRVTIVGNKIFSHKILSDTIIDGDWRKIPKEKLKYIEITLSNEIKQKCLKLNRILNLNYSAIDLVESNGKIFFLEINPTGEWGFLNYDNNIHLEAVICDYLES